MRSDFSFFRLLAVVLALCLCGFFPGAQAAEPGFTLRCGDRSHPRIAVTVDDCYHREQVQAAIDLCTQYKVKLTFFLIGNALKFADAPLWQSALDAGCEIGNHSWSHKNLTKLAPRRIRYEMLRTQQKVDEMLGYHYPMQVMRPPFGAMSAQVANAIDDIGYLHAVKWDVSQTSAAKAIKDVQNGSILLYHARAKDIKCLKALIPQLLEAGYRLVTVSELLGLPPVTISQEIYDYAPEDSRG